MAHPYKNSLLVEGWNDAYVCRDLLRNHKLSCVIEGRVEDRFKPEEHTIKIQESGGFNKLREQFPRFIRVTSELERLGVIVDTDNPDDPEINIANRWESLRHILLEFGVKLPAAPLTEGFITTVVRPKEEPKKIIVGVWLMPNNVDKGTVEDFVRSMVPTAHNPLWERAERAVDDIPQAERLFRRVDTKKAYLHTWLAWQAEPEVQLGQAIKNRYLDSNAPLAQSFIAWVQRLFVDTPLP